MDLYIIRHAIAQERAGGLDDMQRALVPQGRSRFREIVRGLEQLEISLELVQHSPALRAVETAELLGPLLEGEMEVTERLYAPPDEELLREIRGESTALVGHEPWLSQLGFWLLSGWRNFDARGSASPLALKRGGVLHLKGLPRPGEMTLVGLYTPRVLRRLGRR